MPPSHPNGKPPQSILIIGAGRGIGFEILRYLVRNKTQALIITAFDISFEWAKDNPLFQRTHVVNMVLGDVTRAEDRESLMQQFNDSRGIDTLIYCAGLITPIVRIEKLDIDDVKKTFDVNVFGAMDMVRQP